MIQLLLRGAVLGKAGVAFASCRHSTASPLPPSPVSENFQRKLNMINFDISDMRISYDQEIMSEDSLVAKEPIAQFTKWFEEANRSEGIIEANAMCLATAGKNGRPSARMVLLKGFGQNGFKFYTNYDSRKGKELAENPFAALTIYWESLKRSLEFLIGTN